MRIFLRLRCNHGILWVLQVRDIFYENDIIHGDLKLDNIILNVDKTEIKDIKIIDFDVSLFNSIPDKLYPIPEEYEKTLNNKKQRGTRIYMLKDKYDKIKLINMENIY